MSTLYLYWDGWRDDDFYYRTSLQILDRPVEMTCPNVYNKVFIWKKGPRDDVVHVSIEGWGRIGTGYFDILPSDIRVPTLEGKMAETEIVAEVLASEFLAQLGIDVRFVRRENAPSMAVILFGSITPISFEWYAGRQPVAWPCTSFHYRNEWPRMPVAKALPKIRNLWNRWNEG